MAQRGRSVTLWGPTTWICFICSVIPRGWLVCAWESQLVLDAALTMRRVLLLLSPAGGYPSKTVSIFSPSTNDHPHVQGARKTFPAHRASAMSHKEPQRWRGQKLKHQRAFPFPSDKLLNANLDYKISLKSVSRNPSMSSSPTFPVVPPLSLRSQQRQF